MNDHIETGVWTSISVGRDSIGAFLNCGKLGIEAYDADDTLLGVFADEDDAFNVISDCWDRKPRSNGGDSFTIASEEPGLEPGPARAGDGPAAERQPRAKLPGGATPELVLFTKTGGPLTKQISLAPDGTLVKDDTACRMTHGRAERVKIANLDELAALIGSLQPSQAIALGTLRTDLPDRVEVTTKHRLLNGVARPDLIARTNADIVYDGSSFALLDFDTKGMPAAVRTELKRAGGFWDALLTVLPALKDTARVTRRSTSAGLSRADTGEALPGSDGVHVYVLAKGGGDSERFLRALHERCWLAGLGWMMVGAGGALLERSIVDRLVGGPERLAFEGDPVLLPPLRQDKESRRPIAVDGEMLDTKAACPPLSSVEQARLDELKAKERARLAPEAAKARKAFVEVHAKKLVARTGMSEKAARQVIVRQCDGGVLRPDVELPFDDPDLADCTVGDVLADPERFEGETLADPLEGVDYGPCKAKIMRRADGSVWIHSFAHGRTVYDLKLDGTSVRKAMQAATKDDVVATFAGLVVGADVDAVEVEALRQSAAKLSGVGLRAVNSALKAAQQAHAKCRRNEAREHAKRNDPRHTTLAPFPDAPFLPVMTVLNDVIGKVTAAIPPARDIDGDAMWVRKLPAPHMHVFTDANQEGDEQ